MDDASGFIAVRFPSGFPLDDMSAIASDLMAGGGIVAGYVPAERGTLDLLVMMHSKLLGEETIVLPDRNLVSRMSAIAEGRQRHPLDKPSQFAADLMAYCQFMDLNFEPVIALHELGHTEGADEANRELAWFRAGNDAPPPAWLDVSRGRTASLGPLDPGSRTDHDLATPPGRWERNYVVALKIAELELDDRTPIGRALALLDWMLEGFILAGPAAVFASMYFSPFAAKKRLMKSLRSADRARAIDGIRNAAWDMTHLSDFARRIREEGSGPRRFIFATGDRGLAEIARLIPIDAERSELADELARRLTAWWPERDAHTLARRFAEAVLAASSRPPPVGLEGADDPVGDLIVAGERSVRDWKAPEGPGGRRPA